MDELMGEMIKMKSENRNYKLMRLSLKAPKYLASKAKPDKTECIKNQRSDLF